MTYDRSQIDRGGRRLTSMGLAQARPNNWLYLYSQLSCLRNDEVITLTDSEDDTDSVVVIGSDTSEEPTESTLLIFYSV